MTIPESMSSKPERQFSVVVLPQPLGPMIATISPRLTLRSIPRRAGTVTLPVLYVLWTPVASTMYPF